MEAKQFRLCIEDVFQIAGRGFVACGRVTEGMVSVGDRVWWHSKAGVFQLLVAGLEQFNKQLTSARAGETVGIMLQGSHVEAIAKGDLLTGSINSHLPPSQTPVEIPLTSEPESAETGNVFEDATLNINLGTVGASLGRLTISFVVHTRGSAFVSVSCSDPSDLRRRGVHVALDEKQYRKLKEIIANTDAAIDRLRRLGQVKPECFSLAVPNKT